MDVYEISWNAPEGEEYIDCIWVATDRKIELVSPEPGLNIEKIPEYDETVDGIDLIIE